MKRPPSARASRWVESRLWRSASARSSPSGDLGLVDDLHGHQAAVVLQPRPAAHAAELERDLARLRQLDRAGQAAHGRRQRAAVDEALHPHPVVRDGALARVLRRVDDPERRRRRVLGRLGRVGIELVALPHERVDERLERGHPQQLRDRGVVAGQPVGGLARGEPVERRGLQAHPAAARVVGRHQRAPRLHRQLAGGRAAPRHHRDLHLAVQDRAAEVEGERHLAVGQRVDVLGRRHLEVVGAGDVERELGRAAERRHDRADLRPQERARRRRPALGGAEELDEPLARGVVVAALGRLDLQLRRERDRVHGRAGGLGDPQREAQRRRRRVRHRTRGRDLERRRERHAPTAGRARRSSR